jgi:toxin ParE1/3/4
MNPTDKLQVHPEAALELRSARRWYRERNRKAGESFGLEYKATAGRIIQAPLRWPTYAHGTRRHLMHRFPYAIVYRAESDGAVLIVAVAHQAKDEAYWKSRATLRDPDTD